MGDTKTNTYVPFQINYKFSTNEVAGYKPLKPSTVACYESISVILFSFLKN